MKLRVLQRFCKNSGSLYRVSILGVIPQLGSRSKSRSAKFLSLTLTLKKKETEWTLPIGQIMLNRYKLGQHRLIVVLLHSPDEDNLQLQTLMALFDIFNITLPYLKNTSYTVC